MIEISVDAKYIFIITMNEIKEQEMKLQEREGEVAMRWNLRRWKTQRNFNSVYPIFTALFWWTVVRALCAYFTFEKSDIRKEIHFNDKQYHITIWISLQIFFCLKVVHQSEAAISLGLRDLIKELKVLITLMVHYVKRVHILII